MTSQQDPSESRRPLVGVIGCQQLFEGRQPVIHAQRKYLDALLHGAGVTPLIIPPLGAGLDRAGMLARLDGVFLTGSPSNVEPGRYGGAPGLPGMQVDPVRDATSLPLIHEALEAGLPLFAICRGFQEINVALGGTLHQHVEHVPGHINHIVHPNSTVELKYGLAHGVTVQPNGLLDGLIGTGEIAVNSVHFQGVDQLAPGLDVEAYATDGLVEAVRVTGADAFALGVQWHPEWRFAETAHYAAIFTGFGDAVRGAAGA